MNIVLPIAGRGSRFFEAGVPTPKPLIPVLGKPMFYWALNSLPYRQAGRIIFICLKEHLEAFPMEETIRKYCPGGNVRIVVADKLTEGQACNVLLAEEHINNGEGLMIYNGDTYFKSGLESLLAGKPEPDGIISVFKASEVKWSYAKLGPDGFVSEVAEKKVISDLATAGMYYFGRGSDFVSAAREMMARNDRVNNEFYVGPVYNYLIRKGGKVIVDMVREMWGLGTPEDLAYFNKNYKGAAI